MGGKNFYRGQDAHVSGTQSALLACPSTMTRLHEPPVHQFCCIIIVLFYQYHSGAYSPVLDATFVMVARDPENKRYLSITQSVTQ